LLTPVNPSSPAPHYPQRQAPSTDEPAATLNIIGIAESAEPTDVARHEPQYLAEAYAAETPMARFSPTSAGRVFIDTPAYSTVTNRRDASHAAVAA
jgi:hypothetical protein